MYPFTGLPTVTRNGLSTLAIDSFLWILTAPLELASSYFRLMLGSCQGNVGEFLDGEGMEIFMNMHNVGGGGEGEVG